MLPMVCGIARSYGRAAMLTLLHRLTIVHAILLLGCAKPYLGIRADVAPPPVPASVSGATSTFAGAAGIELYERSWRPEGEVRGVLIVMHGLRDHGDRYAELASALVARGYAVYAFDLPGHGRSAGRRVEIGSFEDYVDNFDRYVAKVAAHEPSRPLFVFGHSMGGLIVTRWASEHPGTAAGVILSAPALRIDLPPIAAAVITALAALTPNLGQLAPNNDGFSSDPGIEADMGKDPLIYQPAGPVHTAGQMVRAIERVWAAPGRLTAPLLCLHGTADTLTAAAGCRDLVRRAGSADRTLRLYPGLEHDLVHEPRRAEVTADLLAWLDAHTGGPAPAWPAEPLDRRLRGDGRKPAVSLALEAGYRRDGGDDPGNAGGVATRARALLGRRIAWSIGLDADVFVGSRFSYRAIALPIGVGAAHAGGHTASLSLGGGVSDLGGGTGLELTAALDLELQAGPVRLLGWGRLGWVRDDARQDGTGLAPFADELRLGVAVRAGRNHRYWATANAGAGPHLGLTLEQAGGIHVYGIVVGGQLWGGS